MGERWRGLPAACMRSRMRPLPTPPQPLPSHAHAQAFLGLARVVRTNPEAAVPAFPALAAAIVSWHHIACEGLANDLVQLVRGFRENLVAAGQWPQAEAAMEPAVRQKLQVMCQL